MIVKCKLTLAGNALISFQACMRDWERLALNVADDFRQMKKARRRKLLIWIGTSRFINAWLKQRQGGNIEVGMLTN
jgi:hypothetical protein